jgi:quinohemoprotein ethanol dehydrogenase
MALAAAIGAAGAQEVGPAAERARIAAAAVDQDAVRTAGARGDWLSYGLDHAETRFSPLDRITADNVHRLGLAWSYDLESNRGVQATPLVVDGVMYVTASWSVVHAIDALTGERLWVHDPRVPREYGAKGCCDVVNRGVAIHGGKVFVASYDGRLIALDAATGAVAWEVDTIEDRARPYTITGAPRVYEGLVMIGNGGAEYGVRGYVTAYDAETGRQAWRWYAVPGDPSEPFEDPSMEMAARTWDPAGRWWEAGGGGTIWDSMAYDPDLDLMYVGTGNGSPWRRDARSPAGGDNLFLASIVALRPRTGEYVWHYQVTPGDNWDFTSTQTIILADLAIEGRPRKTLLHAPKNGFFFVLDRETGEFLSAENFVEVNWASGYDDEGRPIENPAARHPTEPFEVIPSAYGAKNWHPMSFNPRTGLVYIPAQGVPLVLTPDPDWEHNAHLPGRVHSNLGWNMSFLVNTIPPQAKAFGQLLAWDPVAQREAWRQEYLSPWNGGTLTTAGNLVFQGTADGRFIAYDARDGRTLWQTPVGSGAVAAPMTWEKDGVQYVSIAVGWGGVYGIIQRATDRVGPGTVYTFRLDGDAPTPAVVTASRTELVRGVAYDPADVAAGAGLYVSNCVFCHGVPAINNGGNVPNLAFSTREMLEQAPRFVLDGTFAHLGMPRFEGKLTEEQVRLIVAFVQGTADAVRGQQAR